MNDKVARPLILLLLHACTVSTKFFSFFFSLSVDIGNVTISPSGPNSTNKTIGQPFTMKCFVTIDPNPLPPNVPPPRFEWFFGLSMEPLTSDDFGMILSSTITRDGHVYASFLNISSLHESHTGLYTCRLGGNERLAASKMVLVTTVQKGRPYANL